MADGQGSENYFIVSEAQLGQLQAESKCAADNGPTTGALASAGHAVTGTSMDEEIAREEKRLRLLKLRKEAADLEADLNQRSSSTVEGQHHQKPVQQAPRAERIDRRNPAATSAEVRRNMQLSDAACSESKKEQNYNKPPEATAAQVEKGPASNYAAKACSEFVRTTFCEPNPLAKQPGEEFQGHIFQIRKKRIMPTEKCNCAGECVCAVSFEVGDTRSCAAPAKFLLIVGETGTGKSTFINGIANAFYKVKFDDASRFKLIAEPEGKAGGIANQAHSQTSIVAIYTLFPVNTGGEDSNCKSAMDCPLTIIDTPGFGDTRGLAEDERIVRKIARVLGEDGKQTPGMSGILHGIGFVVKASQNRLTIPQKYIFDQVLSLFGKDVGQIILPVLTFADSNEPQALAALKEDKVPHAKFLKFNNGMLYADNSTLDSLRLNSSMIGSEKKKREIQLKANELDWDQGECYYLELFELMDSMKDGISLQATRDVLKNRKTLEIGMEGVMKQVRNGIATLTSLKEHLDLIDSLDIVIKDADMKKTRKTKVPKTRRIPVTHGGFVTLCTVCSKTCHDKCAYADDKDKRSCSAMDSHGNCTVCPKNCFWDQHCNRNYFFEDYEEEVIVTVKEIAEKYQVNMKDRDAKAQLLQRLLADFENSYTDLSYNLVTVHKCLQALEQMALRQYPLSVVEYVDNLIKVQENEKKPGWENRVKYMRETRESAKIISDAREGQEPFGDKDAVIARCKKALEAQRKESTTENQCIIS